VFANAEEPQVKPLLPHRSPACLVATTRPGHSATKRNGTDDPFAVSGRCAQGSVISDRRKVTHQDRLRRLLGLVVMPSNVDVVVAG
jgi:hypothetical protein